MLTTLIKLMKMEWVVLIERKGHLDDVTSHTSRHLYTSAHHHSKLMPGSRQLKPINQIASSYDDNEWYHILPPFGKGRAIDRV